MTGHAEQVANLKTAVFEAVKTARAEGGLPRGDAHIFVLRAFSDAWPYPQRSEKDE